MARLRFVVGAPMSRRSVSPARRRTVATAATPSLAVAGKSAQYVAFLRRLHSARERAGMSQTEAARRLGRPQSFISKCESGERRVDVVELKAFARIYGVKLSYFD